MVERTEQYGSRAEYSRPEVYEDYDQKRFTTFGGRLFDRMEKDILLASLPTEKNARILECGAGTGRFSAEVARLGYHLTATDVSEGMLEQARRRVQDAGLADRVEFRIGDIYNLDFPDASFDFVYTIRVLNQLARADYKQRAITEMCRVLKPGGRLLFDVVNKWSLASLRRPDWHISPPTVKRILRSNGMKPVRTIGRMILTQTILEVLPRPAAAAVNAVDRCLCAALPWFGTRVYFLSEKSVD